MNSNDILEDSDHKSINCQRQKIQWSSKGEISPTCEDIDKMISWLREDLIEDGCPSCWNAALKFSKSFRGDIYEATSGRFKASSTALSFHHDNFSEEDKDDARWSSTGRSLIVSDSSEFPSLTSKSIKPSTSSIAVNVLQSKKKNSNRDTKKLSSTSKRRIRPAVIQHDTVRVSNGNISSLPSEEPIGIVSKHSEIQQTSCLDKNATIKTKNVWKHKDILQTKSDSKNRIATNAWGLNDHTNILKPIREKKRQSFSVKNSHIKPSFVTEAEVNKSNVKVKVQTTCESLSIENMKLLMKRIAILYGELCRQHLTPCFASEVTFVINLLSLTKHETKTTGNGWWLSNLFDCKESIETLACHFINITEDLLLNMHYCILESFSRHQSLRTICPHFMKKIDSILKEEEEQQVDRNLSNHEYIGMMKTSIIDLPFQSERDSRHNYRTSELSRLYSNRESTRDSFLRLLRTFQSTTSHFGSNKEDLLIKLQKESNDIILSLDQENMFWFAEIFCDLLLQVGLTPMQETDAEILEQISDKEKLQVKQVI